MWRLWEVLHHLAPAPGNLALAVLNDTASSLRGAGAATDGVRVIAAGRSRVLFVLALMRLPVRDLVVVGHLGQSSLAWLMQLLGRTRGYVVILHGLEAWRRASLLQRLACRRAERIIATTRYTAERFAQANAVSPERLAVLPLCADEALTVPSGFMLQGGFRVLGVGRQCKKEDYKGFDELIDCVSLLRAEGRDVSLHLVGDGDAQPGLRKRARELAIEARVHFHGLLDQADLQAAYRSCEVFALPSRDEGFGIVYLEAMRHSKPCIGARSGGVPEVIEDGVSGLLVPYGDPQALAQALGRLQDDAALRRRLGDAGKRLASTRFSAAAFMSRYRELIGEVLAKTQSR